MKKEEQKQHIGIIGGGAAGVMTAILLARKGFFVTVLEKNDKIGKKLLITGNGRCNLTNRYASEDHYFSRSLNLTGEILKRFPVETTLDTFESMGISVRELENGKMYPYSLEAKTVVKAFLYEMEHLGIRVIYSANVKKIEKQNKWLVTYERKSEEKVIKDSDAKRQAASRKAKTADKNNPPRDVQIENLRFDKIVLCTGGMSYAVSGSDGSGYELAKKHGHTLLAPIPAIVQLVMNEKQFPYYKHLQGTKTEAQIALYCGSKRLRSERGELLFAAYGVSGPPILLLSTAAAYAQGKPLTLRVNFFPEMEERELVDFLKEKMDRVPYYTIEHLLEMFLPNRLIGVLLKQCHISANVLAEDIKNGEFQKILRFLTCLQLEVDKPYQWQQAQVTAGGISCREVSADTLESKKAEGLFFAGEVLDIDGDCGGFNLQWAWSSAMTVAEAIEKGVNV